MVTQPTHSTTSRRYPALWRLVTLIGVCLLAYYAFVAGHSVSDPAGPLPFDASRPFKLDFGRGSGMVGLSTIAIAENGETSICRWRKGTWERASLRLSAQQLNEVAQAVTRHRLPRLAKEYLGTVLDGTQWVLWIRQGTLGKATYFDNNFPGSIRYFANELDAILKEAGIDKLQWEPSSRRDRELWGAMR